MFQIVIGPRQALSQTLIDMYDPLSPRRELWLLTLCFTAIDYAIQILTSGLLLFVNCFQFATPGKLVWFYSRIAQHHKMRTLQNYNSIYFEFQRVINMHPHKCRAKLLIINSLVGCTNIEFIVLVFKNLHPSSNSMSRKPHLTWNIYI